uniref:Piggybac transposable element-derived n=1 Tax=Strongyloides papillosus TaxID=174720 RepID=A0A0N5BHC8_STREA
MKWYLRIFFFVVTQAAVVNAWNIYQLNSDSKIKIVDFKRQIVASMLKLERPKMSRVHHILETVTGKGRIPRRRCVECYQQLSKKFGSNVARQKAKQVKTKCSKCKKYYCLECFQRFHTKCK